MRVQHQCSFKPWFSAYTPVHIFCFDLLCPYWWSDHDLTLRAHFKALTENISLVFPTHLLIFSNPHQTCYVSALSIREVKGLGYLSFYSLDAWGMFTYLCIQVTSSVPMKCITQYDSANFIYSIHFPIGHSWFEACETAKNFICIKCLLVAFP